MNTSTDILPIPLEIEVIEFEVQANADKCHYIVKFSDETQQQISCDSVIFALELMIWSWRINQGLSKDDYVTFGLQFSALNHGKIITDELLTKIFDTAKIQAVNFEKYLYTSDLKAQFKYFLKAEMTRYLKNKTKNKLMIQEVTEGRLKVSYNKDFTLVFIRFLVIFGSFLLIGGGVPFLLSLGSSSNSSSNSSSDYFTSPEYLKSVKERTGIGDTINSKAEIIRVCMTMSQDQGMSYSEAYRRCY